MTRLARPRSRALTAALGPFKHAFLGSLATTLLLIAATASPASALPAPVAVSIAAGPANGSVTNLQTVTFSLSAIRQPLTMLDFGCSIDGAPMDACDPLNYPTCPPTGMGTYNCRQDRSYPGLSEGLHRFKVLATVCSHFVDDCTIESNWVDGPAIDVSFTVDRTAPMTTIVGGPAENVRIKKNKASLAFSANEQATFQCSVDNGPFTPCASPLGLTKLKNGRHSVAIRATDLAGNVGIPATRSFNVKVKAKKRCKRVRGKRKCTNRRR